MKRFLSIFAMLAPFSGVSIAHGAPFRTLFNFSGPTNANGEFALAKDGELFTTTAAGGSAGYGAIIEFNPSTGVETVLYSFQGSGDGAQPVPGLVLTRSGVLYGATAAGGSSNAGTVFKFDTRTDIEQVLHSFGGGGDGMVPQYGPVLGQDGNLYGTTSAGGSSSVGVIYRVKPNTGASKTVLTFAGINGADPGALAVSSSGLLYGSTYSGGANDYYGVLFTFDPSTGAQAILYNFTNLDRMANPTYGLVFGQNGLIYGTGAEDGFSFDPNSGTVADLNVYNSGCFPTGTVVLDQSNNVYGTCSQRGGFGFAFRDNVTTGSVSTLYSFNPSGGRSKHGVSPAGLAFGKNGHLYGTTLEGGSTWKVDPPGYGTIYSLAP